MSRLTCRFLWAFSLVSFISILSVSAHAYQVKDSFGKHNIDAPPKRVVVTDWVLLEQMLELGVTPIGAPELDLYRHYVRRPALPDGIRDIGLRNKPSLSILRELKPDVIILGTDQKKLARPFSHIAPVMYYKSFSDKYRTNGKKSRVRFLQIADLFQKRQLAEKKLAEMDIELLNIKKQIDTYFNHRPPKVTLIRFSSETKCLVYGENSIPLYAMKQIGLQTHMLSSRSKWGEQELPIERLVEIDTGIIMLVSPIDKQAEMFSSARWQALPAVQQNRVLIMSPVWSYGGAMSVLYNARAMSQALINGQ